jgi:hypothetical protein
LALQEFELTSRRMDQVMKQVETELRRAEQHHRSYRVRIGGWGDVIAVTLSHSESSLDPQMIIFLA